MIKGEDTSYYRYPIHEFSFTALDGKEKWTAYKFTKNIYDTWMPTHLDRIRSVIDELPPPAESVLSQDLENRHLSPPLTEPESLSGERGSQSGIVDVEDVTPDTSFTGQGVLKKPRRAVMKSNR